MGKSRTSINQLHQKDRFRLFEFLKKNQDRYMKAGTTLAEATTEAHLALEIELTEHNVSGIMGSREDAAIQHRWPRKVGVSGEATIARRHQIQTLVRVMQHVVDELGVEDTMNTELLHEWTGAKKSVGL